MVLLKTLFLLLLLQYPHSTLSQSSSSSLPCSNLDPYSILAIMIILVIIISTFLLIYFGRIRHNKHKKVVVSSDILIHDNIFDVPKITYGHLSEATDGFDKKNLVGSGPNGQFLNQLPIFLI